MQTLIPSQFALSCPMCGVSSVHRRAVGERLTISCCWLCKHRSAVHTKTDVTLGDYHAQYSGGSFLESLQQTRRRQARLIHQKIVRHLGPDPGILDYGCGLGWFLRECRAAGSTRLAGFDTSPLAIEGLSRHGIKGALVDAQICNATFDESLRNVGLQPSVITFLDVLEHLPPKELRPFLQTVISTLRPNLRLIVIKVPNVGGLLYHVAAALAALGARGCLERLYQVGTDPPHQSYFSQTSMTILLNSLGVGLVEVSGDLDFEPDSLCDRSRLFGGLRYLSRCAGRSLGFAAQALHAMDSKIFYATIA